jgi:hypothetical protein
VNEGDEMPLAQDKRRDGLGPPTWQLSLLDDPGAKFWRGMLVDSKKERGFSAPLLERKNLNSKRESIDKCAGADHPRLPECFSPGHLR